MVNLVLNVFLLCALWQDAIGLIVNVTVHDAARNRDVLATICCDSHSESGSLDLQIFAHGGGLYAADYGYMCSETKSDHATALLGSNASDNPMDLQLMADDIAFLAKALALAGTPIYHLLNGRVSLTGHSMGAAAVLLAGQKSIDGVVAVGALAPGFWGPDQANLLSKLGSQKSALCDRPVLVVEGDQDCANSLPLQGLPVWGNLSLSCQGVANRVNRSLVLMKGTTHCQWTTPVVGSCPFDVPCPKPRLDRAEQQAKGTFLLDRLTSSSFYATLAGMEENGVLSFVNQQSSASDLSKLHSECPCKSSSDVALLSV